MANQHPSSSAVKTWSTPPSSLARRLPAWLSKLVVGFRSSAIGPHSVEARLLQLALLLVESRQLSQTLLAFSSDPRAGSASCNFFLRFFILHSPSRRPQAKVLSLHCACVARLLINGSLRAMRHLSKGFAGIAPVHSFVFTGTVWEDRS